MIRPVPVIFLVVVLAMVVACGGSKEPAAVEVPHADTSGMEPQVVALLQKAEQDVTTDSESSNAWGELGSAYDAHGLRDLAVTCYRRAHELAPEQFEWIYLLAVVREIGGAPADEVLELFGKALEIRPTYVPIYVRLGDALSLRGEHAAAERHLRQALQLAPEVNVAHRGLAQALLAQGDAEEAARHFARAVELEPRDLTAYTGLAQALMRLDQPRRAQEVIDSSRGLGTVSALDDPVFSEHVFARSVSSSRAFSRSLARIREGDFAGAVNDLALVLAARPEDASAHFWAGTAYQRLGRVEPAAEHLSRAVELEPTMARGWMALAQTRAAQGRLEESVRLFRESLRLNPRDADGHDGLGQVLQRLGRTAEARTAYESALRIDPDHPARRRIP